MWLLVDRRLLIYIEIPPPIVFPLSSGSLLFLNCSYPYNSPSRRAIHAPQISTRIYGGIPRDHPCGNFLMISLRKFRGNEGNFLCGFSVSFPCEICGDISTWKFPSCFPVQFDDIGRVPVMWKYPCYDLMSFFSELRCLQVWGNSPLISTPI